MKIWINKLNETVCEITAEELAATQNPFAVVQNDFHGGGVEDYYKSLAKAEAHTSCGGDCCCGGGGVMFAVSELSDYTDPETELTPAECTWIKLPTGEMIPVTATRKTEGKNEQKSNIYDNQVKRQVSRALDRVTG